MVDNWRLTLAAILTLSMMLSLQYSIKWEGLLNLLDDVQLNSIADQLKEAALVGADLLQLCTDSRNIHSSPYIKFIGFIFIQ